MGRLPGAGSPLLEARQIGKIPLPLLGPSIITCLVLGADEAVRAPVALRPYLEIGSCSFDRIFHVGAVHLDRFEDPGRTRRIGEESAQLRAMRALTTDLALAAPILRRLQRLRDARLQVVDA